MRKPAVLIFVFVLCLFGAADRAHASQAEGADASASAGDSTESAAEKNRRRLAELTEGQASSPGGGDAAADSADPMLPIAPQPSALEGETKAKYEEALREYYDYHISGLRHRSKVFEWQLFSSRLIFVAVLLLVVAGIYFAAVQFHASLGRSVRGTGDGEEETATTTEFSASMEGIKVSSPVLGVVILVISLAFFYFYLVYVYPIENIF